MKINRIAQGMNVAPMLWALQEHSYLWDQNTSRTRSEASPHHGLSDIFARYAADPTHNPDVPHDSVWYPCAEVLPVRELVMPLMSAVHGTRLGGVLITKIPAGAECKPHSDPGWHARYYDKFAIQIASAPEQRFCFDGESLETRPGDVYWFDNAHTHWVTNPTPHDRITLIACIKQEKE